MPQLDEKLEQSSPDGAGSEQLYIYAYPNESNCVDQLIQVLRLGDEQRDRISETASTLIQRIRQRPDSYSLLERFLSEYSLSQQEGVVLMCLAEAMLRIPDNETRNRLKALGYLGS